MKHKWLAPLGFLIGALVLVGVLFFGVIYFTKTRINYGRSNTVYNVLASTNPAYATGQQLMASGKYDQAIQQFQIALKSSTDPVQEGQIAIKIASATQQSGGGNNLAAIPLYKAIAANTSYTGITRAYAVEYMGEMYFVSNNPDVTSAIFDAPPYSSLANPSDVSQSYRNLFAYSTTLYPLALSELRAADWYATDVVNLSTAAGSSSPSVQSQITSDKSIIKQNIATANADIARIQSTPNNSNESGSVPLALMREGVIAAKMQYTGDNSFGDMESIFQQVLNMYALNSQQQFDGFDRYNYAHYLALLFGAKRASTIQSLLAPFYTNGNLYTNTDVIVFFRDSRTNSPVAKRALVGLAKTDPKFRAYLITLGWQQSDFTQ